MSVLSRASRSRLKSSGSSVDSLPVDGRSALSVNHWSTVVSFVVI